MIAKIDCIRRVRPIAQNIDGISRIEPYIREAEQLNILPQIGADVYRWFDETDFEAAGPWVYTTPAGRQVHVTKQLAEELLYGGYYAGACGSEHSMGLVAAAAYYAYARAVLDHQVNVTSFGVVKKRSEFSDPVDATTLIQVSREAKKLGDEVTREVIGHLKAVGIIASCAKPKRLTKFRVIGSKKM